MYPPKKILFVEQNTDETIGGSYFSLLCLVERLNRYKYEPYVMFYENNEMVSNFRNARCKVIVWKRPIPLILKEKIPLLKRAYDSKSLFILYIPLFLFQKLFNFTNDTLFTFLRFRNFLKRNNIKLVHLNNSVIKGHDWLLAAKMSGVKCITHDRGGIGKISYLSKCLTGHFDAVICVSKAVEKNVSKNIPKNSTRILTIYNGIDPDFIESHIKKGKKNVREEFNIKDGVPLIGIVGNIKKWKGQEVLIKAVKLLKKNYNYNNIRCLIIGDVSNIEREKHYFESLKQLSGSYNLSENIIFTGFRMDVLDLIDALDILVHCSIAPEPFGRVILEGMVLKKPVIATNIGGPVEIIEDGISGFLVSPNDPLSLAQKIDYLLSHSDIAEKVGIVARRHVKEKFHIKLNILKIEKLYTLLL